MSRILAYPRIYKKKCKLEENNHILMIRTYLQIYRQGWREKIMALDKPKNLGKHTCAHERSVNNGPSKGMVLANIFGNRTCFLLQGTQNNS